jgi:hypothetical protein
MRCWVAIFREVEVSRLVEILTDDKGSEQNVEPLQSPHHRSVGYQFMRHKLTLPRMLIPKSTIENTSKNEEDAI